MAAVIRLTELDITPDILHISTDYQVATDKLFGNIVATATDDHENLTEKVFNIELDPSIKYYARARVRLSTGYTAWGNVDLFTPDNINDIAIDLDLPTLVGIPRITLDDANDNFPLSLFNINVSGFVVNSTAKHTATTYIIETVDGDLVWSSHYNEYERDSIFVDNVILKKDAIYRIKAMFHVSSGDVSQISTVTVKTMTGDAIQLVEDIVYLDPLVDNTLHILYIPHLGSSTLNVYTIESTSSSKVFEYITQGDPTVLKIPIGTLVSSKNYFITISTDVTTDILYKTFTTY